jgi:nicotinamidase-related amidase
VSTVQISAHNAAYCRCLWSDISGLRKVGWTLRNTRIGLEASNWASRPPHIFEHYDQIVLPKRHFDPFEEPLADRILTELDPDEFLLVGALAEGAIRATALGLLARQKKVEILLDATGSLERGAAKEALCHIQSKGAKLINTEELLGRSSLDCARAHC